MTNFTLNSRKNGKHTVSYNCEHCQSPLASPLEEAGQTFPCPTCGITIQTPGIEELQKRRVAKEQQRIEKAKRDEIERGLNEIAKARIAAEMKAEAAREQAASAPMGKWRISGVWRDTGEHVELVIDSPTATKAESIASDRGVTVASSNPVMPIPTARVVGIPLKEGWSGRPNKNDIVCPNPNCGYHGPGKKKSKASVLVLIILLLWMIIPGILYALLCGGEVLICPRCGTKARDI